MRGLLYLCLFCLAGCVTGVSQRVEQARELADAAGMTAFVHHSELPLFGYQRISAPGRPLWVFIEGDGLAWVTASRPSRNPTPLNPVALTLAAADTADNVVYLARPGQYLEAEVSRRYWLEARFAPEVVAAMASAVRDRLVAADSRDLYLVGYSGGAAVAALLARELRDDDKVRVLGLMTVAGNLAPDYWTRLLDISPLTGSLNPARRAVLLRDLPQRHLVGSRDRTVPPAVVEHFLDQLGGQHCVDVLSFDLPHPGPWVEAWRSARAEPLQCRPDAVGGSSGP